MSRPIKFNGFGCCVDDGSLLDDNSLVRGLLDEDAVSVSWNSTNNANQNMNDDIAESRLYEVRDQGGNNVNPGAIQRLNCKENIVIDLNIVPTQSPEVFEPEYQTNEDLSIVGESIVQVPKPSRTAVGWKKGSYQLVFWFWIIIEHTLT